MGDIVRPAKILGIIILTLFMTPVALADDWTVTLIPESGRISGPPGSTIGWGYKITNNGNKTLVVSGLNSGSFLNATPDSSIFDFPIIAPNSTAVKSYVINTSGIYQLTWDKGTPTGLSNKGNLVLTADWCEGECTNEICNIDVCTPAPEI